MLLCLAQESSGDSFSTSVSEADWENLCLRCTQNRCVLKKSRNATKRGRLKKHLSPCAKNMAI